MTCASGTASSFLSNLEWQKGEAEGPQLYHFKSEADLQHRTRQANSRRLRMSASSTADDPPNLSFLLAH